MRPFEDELRNALKPVEPPPGFAERVMARVEARRTRPRYRWAAIAAVLLLTAGLGYRQHVQRQRALEAKEQLMLGLRIAGSRLREIRSQILREDLI
ncbi:MAG: hypothetical protein NTY38_08525 [Acidobacteria bacterium]|nr:hypothetical protein [Acidobacteriota bacterium]